ncbi:hypothetical protein AMTRI_Chr03g51520 [Amborella trichopoda]
MYFVTYFLTINFQDFKIFIDLLIYTNLERVNSEGPYLGLVMAYPQESDALLSSGAFTPSPEIPFLEFSEDGIYQISYSYTILVAKNLKEKDLELQRCINATFCLPKTPKVVLGLRASTADIFVDNAAFRNFMFDQFGVSTVDEESFVVVMDRGSDLAGGGGESWSSTTLSSLASINAVKAAIEFIKLVNISNIVKPHF